MNWVKRKRIYYVPGIVTLTFLSFVFIGFANEELQRKSIGAIPIFVADRGFTKKYPEIFKKYKRAFPPKRNYTEILLTGNTKWDRIKLDFAQIRIWEILSAKDSLNGLHFQFGDSSQYWTFVKTVDILRTEGAKTYIPIDKDLWFIHFPPDTTIKYVACGTGYYRNAVDEDLDTSWWSKTTDRIIQVWKSLWQIILALLAFVALIFIIKREKKHAL